MTAAGAVIAAIVGAVGMHIAQSKRLDRAESDIAVQTQRLQRVERIESRIDTLEASLKRLEAELSAFASQTSRLERLETDLAVFFSSRETARVLRPLIDAFTQNLAVEPLKSVTLAVYLRSVAEDEMMRRMTEVLASQRAGDVRKEYEALKRNLTVRDPEKEDEP